MSKIREESEEKEPQSWSDWRGHEIRRGRGPKKPKDAKTAI